MNKFKQILLKFQALSLRERLLAVAAAVAVLYFLTDFALLAPQSRSAKGLQQQISQQKTELDALNKVMAELSKGPSDDGLAKQRAERDDLRARVTQAESTFGQAAKGASLGELLRAMIGERPDLTLASLRTLPAEVFYKPPPPVPGAPPSAGASSAAAASAPAPQLTLYKHGVEVSVRGKYAALLAYLQSLQGNPNRMFWASVKLDVATYPEATLLMIVYTLSDRAESPLG